MKGKFSKSRNKGNGLEDLMVNILIKNEEIEEYLNHMIRLIE
jgi:hypothetical protein